MYITDIVIEIEGVRHKTVQNQWSEWAPKPKCADVCSLHRFCWSRGAQPLCDMLTQQKNYHFELDNNK